MVHAEDYQYMCSGRGKEGKNHRSHQKRKSDRSRGMFLFPAYARDNIPEGRRESRTESVHGGNRKYP